MITVCTSNRVHNTVSLASQLLQTRVFHHKISKSTHVFGAREMRMWNENGEQKTHSCKDCAYCFVILNNSSFHSHTLYIPGTSALSAIWMVFLVLLLLPFLAFSLLSFSLAFFSECSCFSSSDLRTCIFLFAQLAFNSSPIFFCSAVFITLYSLYSQI